MIRPEGVTEVVRRPVQLAGLTFMRDPTNGSALDDLIIEEACANRESLPLLGVAMAQLVANPVGNQLTFSQYEKSGGLAGAIQAQAEAAYASLQDADKANVRGLFLSLVSYSDGGNGAACVSREPVSMERLSASCQRIVHHFANARLLVIGVINDRQDNPSVQSQTVRIVHDALLSQWSKLSGWIKESSEQIRLRRHVEQRAAYWIAANKDSEALEVSRKAVVRTNRLTDLFSVPNGEVVNEYLRASTKRAFSRGRIAFTLLTALLLIVTADALNEHLFSRLTPDYRQAFLQLIFLLPFVYSMIMRWLAPRYRILRLIQQTFWYCWTIALGGWAYATAANEDNFIEAALGLFLIGTPIAYIVRRSVSPPFGRQDRLARRRRFGIPWLLCFLLGTVRAIWTNEIPNDSISFWRSAWFQTPIITFLVIWWAYPEETKQRLFNPTWNNICRFAPHVAKAIQKVYINLTTWIQPIKRIIVFLTGAFVLVGTSTAFVYAGWVVIDHSVDNNILKKTNCSDTLFLHTQVPKNVCRYHGIPQDRTVVGGSFFSSSDQVKYFGFTDMNRQCTSQSELPPGAALMQHLRLVETVVGAPGMCSLAYPRSAGLGLRSRIFNEDVSGLSRAHTSTGHETLQVRCSTGGCIFVTGQSGHTLGELITKHPVSDGVGWSAVFVPTTAAIPERVDLPDHPAAEYAGPRRSRTWQFNQDATPISVVFHDTVQHASPSSPPSLTEMSFKYNATGQLSSVSIRGAIGYSELVRVEFLYDDRGRCIESTRHGPNNVRYHWPTCKPVDYLPKALSISDL